MGYCITMTLVVSSTRKRSIYSKMHVQDEVNNIKMDDMSLRNNLKHYIRVYICVELFKREKVNCKNNMKICKVV